MRIATKVCGGCKVEKRTVSFWLEKKRILIVAVMAFAMVSQCGGRSGLEFPDAGDASTRACTFGGLYQTASGSGTVYLRFRPDGSLAAADVISRLEVRPGTTGTWAMTLDTLRVHTVGLCTGPVADGLYRVTLGPSCAASLEVISETCMARRTLLSAAPLVPIR